MATPIALLNCCNIIGYAPPFLSKLTNGDIIIPSSSPNGNEVNEEQTAASNRNEKLQSDTIADESDAAVEVEEKEDDGDGIDNDNHNDEEGVYVDYGRVGG